MFGSIYIAVLYVIWYIIIGALTGFVTGLLFAVILKGDKAGVWKEAVLGGFGMILGIVLVAAVPVPRNTITYKIGETTVTSTENRFQHPLYIAFALAVAFPAIRALRSAKANSHQSSGTTTIR